MEQNKPHFSQETLSIMRNHKDTVFRLLFNDPKELLSLYNALNNTHYTDESQLEIQMMDHAIYMGVQDDVAFILDSRLNIYEQQASFNPNMPLRDLIYIATHFSMYIKDKSIYSAKLLRIPVPRFIVFYNGTQKQPERVVQKLSDSFAFPDKDPHLELKVLMLNINKGYNQELLEKCRVLQEYCIFVQTIRDLSKEYPIAEAVTHAVDHCINNNVLRDFLLTQKAQVIQMLIYEFDVENEIRKLQQTEYEFGREDGLAEGRSAGLAEGRSEALSQGAEAIITLCQEFKLTKEPVLERLMQSLSIEKELAESYLEKYWKE